ncbi:hypothetical protein F5B20DRAFT_451191 [Whalleya microplaca]|nr:hypothetical protein F5B20DRAFT_451191 [Whalleya microplaca]
MCFCSDEDYDERPLVDEHKRRRQEEAARAAQNYGWGGQPRVNNPRQRTQMQAMGNRDSYIEPHLRQAIVGLPGSEFEAVYDPTRPPRPPHPRQQPPRSQVQPKYTQYKPAYNIPTRPQQAHQHQQRAPPPPPLRTTPPQYHQQHNVRSVPRRQVVQRQPVRVDPMRAMPVPPPSRDVQRTPQVVQRPPVFLVPARKPVPLSQDLRKAPQVVQRHPGSVMPARRAVVQMATPSPQQQSRYAPPPRRDSRDSNGVSVFGSDDDDDDDSWRNHTVSPGPEPSPRENLYNYMQMNHGRGGGAF